MMKRVLASILLVVVAIYGLAAIEYGGLISNDSSFEKYGNNDFVFIEKLDASAYLKAPLTKDGKLVFSTEVFYRFQYVQTRIFNFIDLPLLKLDYSSKIGEHSLNVSLGRFSLADRTGKIFSQTSDGFVGSYATDIFSTSLYFGYTGLVNRHIVSMIERGITEFTGFQSDFYSSSLPYLAMNANITFPFLFLQQTAGAEFWGFIGTQNLKSNKIYGSIALNGPIIGNLFHNTEGIFATIITNDAVDYAGLIGTRLSYYFDWYGLTTNVGATYASEKFQTVTDTSALAMGANWTNIFVPAVSVTILPLSSLFVGLETSIALAANNMQYMGTELLGLVNYQLFSDVSLGFSASHYFAREEAQNNTKISIKAAISF